MAAGSSHESRTPHSEVTVNYLRTGTRSRHSARATRSSRGFRVHGCCVASHAARGGSGGPFALPVLRSLRANPRASLDWSLHRVVMTPSWRHGPPLVPLPIVPMRPLPRAKAPLGPQRASEALMSLPGAGAFEKAQPRSAERPTGSSAPANSITIRPPVVGPAEARARKLPTATTAAVSMGAGLTDLRGLG